MPELKAFELQPTVQNADALLRFFNAYVPLVRSEARGPYTRSILTQLKQDAPDLASRVDELIAISNLTDGMPDRAQVLKDHPRWSGELNNQTQELERMYGAHHVTLSWNKPSRGASLLLYLKQNDRLIRGKKVLHIAPEPEPRGWLQANCSYHVMETSLGSGADIAADITELPIPDRSFDVILCHRVLEHVLDDISAMREMFRILVPGGVANLSVPQATHREETAEWLVSDESHDGHVRQYGWDFGQRLESVGFSVQVQPWLLNCSREKLLECGAYPMRMYEATRCL